MSSFSGKPKELPSRNRLKFQEQTCWAGIMGMSLGYLVALVWILAHGFVSQNTHLQLIVAAGFLVAVGKPLVDKIFVSLIVPLAVKSAARRGIPLDDVDLARSLPLPQVVLLVSGVSISVAIFLTKLGFADYEILWSCSVAGIITGMLRNWSDKEQNLRARENTWESESVKGHMALIPA